MGDGDMIERPGPGQFEPPLPRPEQPTAPQVLQPLEITIPLVQPSLVEARSILAPRSILNQVIETQLLPPERFKGEQKGEVVDIKKIGETVAALKKVDDHYEVAVYNAQGEVTEGPIDPTSYELFSTKNQNVRKKKDTSDGVAVSTILEKLGFSNEAALRAEQQFQSKAPQMWPGHYDDVTELEIKQQPPMYFFVGPWRLEVKQNPTGQEMFLVSFGVDHFQIVTSSVDPPKRKPIKEAEYRGLRDSKTDLEGGLRLRRETSIFNITDEEGKVLSSYSGTEPVLDPNDSNKLYFINTGQIYSLEVSGTANRTSRPVLEPQLKVENPVEIDFDPNGNFLIARSANNKLSILDKESGDVVKTFDGVRGPVLVDNQGDVLYVDPQGKLRQIQTNFQAIPAGGSETAQKRREEELRQMQERFANLELKKVERSRTGQISEDTVAATLRENLSKQVTTQITEATKPEIVEDVLDRLQALKGDPANQAYIEVIDEFVNQARERLSGIRTVEFDGQLTAFQKALDEVKSVGDTIGLDEQFGKLLELRQKIDVADPQQRREIEQRMRALQTKKDTLNNQYQGELIEAVNQTLPQIEQLVRETGSPQELAFFGSSSQAQQFEMMLANVRNPQVRKELRDRYNGVRAEQRAKLEESSKQLAEQDRQRWAQVVEEAREDLGALQEQIAQLSDIKEIDRFGRHPLVTAWRSKLFALPPELRAIEEKRLEIILGARQKDMEHRKELGAVGETGELRFGQATFPIYKEPPRLWQPKFVHIKDALSDWADLVFEDSQGRVWKPEGEQRTVVVADMNDERTKRMIERYRREADEYFKGIKRKVPEFDEHWRITDFHMGNLEELAEALNLQLDNHRGVTILQGEAGTGKNVLVDILGNLSNREVIQIACNENTVKEDLTYEFYYDPGKGTYKLPSRLIEGLQTPGTIILFDEINALKPGIAKMMNSLFDYHRRLYLPESGKEPIQADPTVLLVGTMNPQNYAGVNTLSPEVKSRSRVIDIEYPPFEEKRGGRTYYRSDEAEMLAAYMDDLSELKQKEFKQVWDYVINRDSSNGGDRIVQGNPQIETDVRRVYDVIRVANRLREMYSAYQTGDSNEPMDFPTSLREVTDIVMEMNHRQGVKPMVKRVIVPKIDDRRQKKLVQQTIDAVLPDAVSSS